MTQTTETTLQYCIQCTDKASGKVGDFIYDLSLPFHAVSPVFDDFSDLCRWMRSQGYVTGMGKTWNAIYK